MPESSSARNLSTNGRPSIPRYGKRVFKGREVDFKVEQRVIEMIQGMKNEELTLRAIARCLTQLKVPTKRQGKSWHPEMVRRILDRSNASIQEPRDPIQASMG